MTVQVWDFITGKLKKDLQFQADEQFMMHDEAVLALSFSKDSELLVSGSQDGKIKASPRQADRSLHVAQHVHSAMTYCPVSCCSPDAHHAMLIEYSQSCGGQQPIHQLSSPQIQTTIHLVPDASHPFHSQRLGNQGLCCIW